MLKPVLSVNVTQLVHSVNIDFSFIDQLVWNNNCMFIFEFILKKSLIRLASRFDECIIDIYIWFKQRSVPAPYHRYIPFLQTFILSIK